MTDKGREYRKEITGKRRRNVVSRIMRKSREIVVLLYCHCEREISLRNQLSDIFNLIEEINQEVIELDENYTEELWFTHIDEKVISFKAKVHNWLTEGDEIQRIKQKSISSCSRSTSFKSSSRSSSSN